MHQPYHPNIFMMSSPQLEQNRHQSHPQSSHLLKYIELFPEIIPLEISFQTHDDCPDGHIHSGPSAHQFKVLCTAIFCNFPKTMII